ncbi:MAG: glycoside hydrolase family 9 protein [Oscillospiraceae bacterium]|nr:glycoside hydrolase family 9 protein [Oscillospiraceae bacterium]
MKIKRLIAAALCAALAVSSAPLPQPVVAADATVEDSGVEIDYARALQYSIYFYDANMCGTEVGEHTRLSWRDDCHTYDAHVPMVPWDGNTVEGGGTNLSQEFMDKYKDVLDPDGDGTIDVAGGMHDAGDHVEFGMPENYAAATLGWGFYEFRDSYVKLRQDDHIETVLRHFNDYLMKCTFRDKDGTVIAHCYQVGEGGIDHAVWEAPEVDTMVRPAYFLTAEKPQTDYVVSACASLAINYLNFKDTDPEYAEKSLDYAQALSEFANANKKELSDNGDGPGRFYQSTKWEDDYCWAAAWMYLATGDASVFDDAYEIFDYYAASGWVYCWNDMWSGASVLWARINQEHPELDMVQKCRDAQGKNEYVFDDFWDNDCVGKILKTYKEKTTPQGMVFIDVWGSCRYASAFALVCAVYDKYHNDGKPSEWSEFAKHQIDYILGDNDITYKETAEQTVLSGRNGTHGKRVFLCGYDPVYSVMNPHHRAASGLTMAEDPREQKHVLWGALAGGPDDKDRHSDSTNDWRENEVTIDYNAAFVGACAAMYEYYGTNDMAVTANFPPEEVPGEDEQGGSGYWVEALGLDNREADGTGAVEVSMKVYSGLPKPSQNITVRYYIDASEVEDPTVITTSKLFDQAEMEIKGTVCTVSDPIKWDKMDNVYYVEVSWEGCTFANSGKKCQFSVGFYGKGYTGSDNAYHFYQWDPTNDWSFETMKLGEKTDFFAVENPPEVLNERICVYDDGVLVGGIEPDGTVPETGKQEETTETTGATAAPDQPSGVLYGDVDCNEKVELLDVITLNKNMLGMLKLTDEGTANADVDLNKKVDTTDSLYILQSLVSLVTLPVEK